MQRCYCYLNTNFSDITTDLKMLGVIVSVETISQSIFNLVCCARIELFQVVCQWKVSCEAQQRASYVGQWGWQAVMLSRSIGYFYSIFMWT